MTDQEKLDLVTNYFAEDWAIDKAMHILEEYEKMLSAEADSQPVPVVDKCTKQQMTTEVLTRMQQQEDGHNKNPFRPLLERLMRNEGGYSTTEIGQLKYALDGFYGAARAPADSVTAPAGGVVPQYVQVLPKRARIPKDFLLPNCVDKQHNVGRIFGSGKAVWHTDGEGKFWCGQWHHRTPRELESECLSILHDLWAIAGISQSTPPAQAADSVLEDAARYRWLRTNAIGAFRTNNGNGPVSVYHLSKIPALPGILEETDAAIDAAMNKGCAA